VTSWDFHESGGALVKRADQARYAAKAKCRNRYVTA
jgi:PleD family two-component response regulator